MHPRAADIVERLGLAPHPEGGFYREVVRSPERMTSIYYLLPAGEISALHRVRGGDELWLHLDGDPVELHLLSDLGVHEVHVLGTAFEHGEQPQAIVTADTWQAVVPRGDRFALFACVVVPPFEMTRFEMPSRAELLRRFPTHVALVMRLTRPEREADG